MDGTTSGDTVDSTQVEGMQLAEESQHACQSQRLQNSHSLMSSWPPIQRADCLYRDVRHRRQHRRIKFIPTKVSQTAKVETAYLECAHATQPRGNPSKCLSRVIGPRHQCGRNKIRPVKVEFKSPVHRTAKRLETGLDLQPHYVSNIYMV